MVVVGCGGGGEVGGEARRAAEAEMDGWVRLLDGLGAVEHPHRDFFFAESGNLFSVNSSGRAILNIEIPSNAPDHNSFRSSAWEPFAVNCTNFGGVLNVKLILSCFSMSSPSDRKLYGARRCSSKEHLRHNIHFNTLFVHFL